MKLAVLLSALFLVACGSTSNQPNLIEKEMKAYTAEAQKLVKLAKTNGSKKKIRKSAYKLVDTANSILKKYKTKYPECSELLTFMMKNSKKMTKLTLKQIENDFHDGDALPKAPESCFEPKELLVHPATVVIITKRKFNKEGKEQIVDEIEEVLAHADELKI